MGPEQCAQWLLEKEVVASLCRPVSEAGSKRVGQLVEQNPDWDRIIQLASEWEAEPLVFSSLRARFSGAIPNAARDRMAASEQAQRAWAVARTLATVDMVRAFADEGIPTIVLKGPAIGVTAYGDPSLRGFSDIDLLVSRKNLPGARDLLLSRGHLRDYEADIEPQLIRDDHALEFSGPGVRVELHCALLERHLRFEISADELWSASRIVRCCGRDIRVLSKPHLFLFLCAHGAKHQWASVRWIVDLAQLMDRMDETEIRLTMEWASRTHAKRLLALGIRTVRDFLGVDISRFRESDLVDEEETRTLTASAVAAREAPNENRLDHADPDLAALLYWARTRERLVDRLWCLARVAFVPTVNDTGRGSLRALRRPFRLASRALKAVNG